MYDRSPILDLLKFIGHGATVEDLRAACRRVIDQSDLIVAASVPYSDRERDAIAEGILRFIIDPEPGGMREIVFETTHTLVGSNIELFEFASRFSNEFLYLFCAETWEKVTDPALRRRRLLDYLAAILFRYTWCIDTDAAAFPISEVIRFARLCSEEPAMPGAEEIVFREVALLTLLALQSRESPSPGGESASPRGRNGPGRLGGSLPRGSHRSGLAQFGHPARHVIRSLRDGTPSGPHRLPEADDASRSS